jgi:hypothetical protein
VRTAGSDSNDESKVPDPFKHFRELTSEEAFDHARVRCVRFSERVEPLPDGYRLRAQPPEGEAVFLVLPAVAAPAPRSLEDAGWLATADQVLWFNVEHP